MRTRWQVMLGMAALVAFGVLVWVRPVRERAWLEEMRATGCWPLVPLADIVVLAWASVALALVAGVLLVRAGLRGLRWRSGALAAAVLVVSAATLVGAAVLGLDAAFIPTDPLDGGDGSGLPCGGG